MARMSADIRTSALDGNFDKMTRRLASELGREDTLEFHARRLVRNVASEALNLQSRVNHVFRNREKMEWTGGAVTDLKAIISRLEHSLKTAREVEARVSVEPSQLMAAE